MTSQTDTTLNYMPAEPVSASKAALWTGRVISALPVLMLLMSAGMKLAKHPLAVKGFEEAGFPAGTLMILGIVELACALIYAFPGTAFLGAILVTGYLGGATATHVRGAQPWFTPVILGVLAWLGLYLRDRRVRALIPFRSRP
jgi:hypothetical protein